MQCTRHHQEQQQSVQVMRQRQLTRHYQGSPADARDMWHMRQYQDTQTHAQVMRQRQLMRHFQDPQMAAQEMLLHQDTRH